MITIAEKKQILEDLINLSKELQKPKNIKDKKIQWGIIKTLCKNLNTDKSATKPTTKTILKKH